MCAIESVVQPPLSLGYLAIELSIYNALYSA